MLNDGVSIEGSRQLLGHSKFVRQNPKSDNFGVKKFHHIEFWCQDATNTYKRFQVGLGMQLIAKSDLSTGNSTYASYVLRSGDITFMISAPYAVSQEPSTSKNGSSAPMAAYSQEQAYSFVKQHGLAIRAVGLLVDDARQAYDVSVANGAVPVMRPQLLREGGEGGREQWVSEVHLYGDVVLRYVSGDTQEPWPPGYQAVEGRAVGYGLVSIDHCVGNVPKLLEVVDYIKRFTGFHEFAEFTAEDVGTIDSGLNSIVLANNTEHVLLPVNEPTFGTARKSQIQTYLEQNVGAGVQHLALHSSDVFATVAAMRERSDFGGFEFMKRPSDAYYAGLPDVIGDVLTAEQYEKVRELGLLVDRDDQGVLVQIFTQPVGDRPTFFIEIIQRLCQVAPEGGVEAVRKARDPVLEGLPLVGGCGGFGKGNFKELFKSIEDYERTLKV